MLFNPLPALKTLYDVNDTALPFTSMTSLTQLFPFSYVTCGVIDRALPIYLCKMGGGGSLSFNILCPRVEQIA